MKHIQFLWLVPLLIFSSELGIALYFIHSYSQYNIVEIFFLGTLSLITSLLLTITALSIIMHYTQWSLNQYLFAFFVCAFPSLLSQIYPISSLFQMLAAWFPLARQFWYDYGRVFPARIWMVNLSLSLLLYATIGIISYTAIRRNIWSGIFAGLAIAVVLLAFSWISFIRS